ncbi:hypothetical protein D9M71_603270 [compost metagenome]
MLISVLGKPVSAMIGCETVSVMPHQPMVLMPKACANAGSQTPVPHRRKACCCGRGWASKARMKNGRVECQVQRLRTATSQKRLAEKRGCRTRVPPLQSDVMKP